jgi:hypothetical protein
MPKTSYALLTYQAYPEYNIGDYIQSLAAAQFLPEINRYISREKLNEYSHEQIKLILNGWFMHQPSHWPPSEKIDALPISFHLNSQAKNQLLNEEGKQWFKKNEPIGCRDQYTLKAMHEAGIEAWLSGCLTTTFTNKFTQRTNDIYFVDALFRVPGWTTITRTPRDLLKGIINGTITKAGKRKRILQKLFDGNLLNSAKELEHYHTARHSEKERFTMAESFLEKYATAKLVVTSRLHCALPCLAFGTPVIFINGGFTEQYDQCRLEGTINLFNTISIDEQEKITANFDLPQQKIGTNFRLPNPETFRKFVTPLKEACHNFINAVPLPA